MVFWLPLTTMAGLVTSVQVAGDKVGEDCKTNPVADVGQERMTLFPDRLIARLGPVGVAPGPPPSRSWSSSACVYWASRLVWVLNRNRSTATPASRYEIVKFSGLFKSASVTSYLCGVTRSPDTSLARNSLEISWFQWKLPSQKLVSAV